MSSISSWVSVVRNDFAKVFRYAAVAVIAVPIGLALLTIFLEVFDFRPVAANLSAASLAAIPNYLMNRYWVWNKRGANSVRREIAPFWIMALLGALVSSAAVWIASQFTDQTLIFLAANFCSFGLVWVLKFFVLEKYLFGESTTEADLEDPALA